MSSQASTMSELSTQLQDASQKKECSPSIPEQFRFKNRLQEYTQKSSIQLPVYHTVNEGSPHAPRFRSTVSVDGKEFVSPNTFSSRKAAEQDVARIALDNIFQSTKDDIYPFIREDTIFCKSILNEYAVKMNLERPTYNTSYSKELLPIFVSEVAFNGVKFKGEVGRNKREAEQTAARAAILSALDSGSRTVISEIIKSKSKLYAAFNKVKDTISIESGALPIAAGINSNNVEVPSNKRKEVENTKEITIAANTPISGALEAQSADNQAACLPHHQFKKPKAESSSEEMALPIIYVPPVLGESLTCSTSGEKGNCKDKEDKEVEQREQGNTQSPIAVMPLNQVPQPPLVQ